MGIAAELRVFPGLLLRLHEALKRIIVCVAQEHSSLTPLQNGVDADAKDCLTPLFYMGTYIYVYFLLHCVLYSFANNVKSHAMAQEASCPVPPEKDVQADEKDSLKMCVFKDCANSIYGLDF